MNTRTVGRALLLAAGGIIAALAGCILIFLGFFPYAFAESGQGSYIATHRAELTLEIAGGFALGFVALVCFWKAFRLAVQALTSSKNNES